MKAFSFQVQIQKSKHSAEDLIHEIDPRAPIPEPMEGGNGKGPLYECVIDAKLKEKVLPYCAGSGDAIVYTSFYEIEIDESLYRPDYYVKWQFGKDTIVSVDKY